jgi:hypothetical protein
VLVVLDAGAESEASIAEAGALAAVDRAELVGVFVEESAVEQAMALESVRLVSTPGGALHDVDPQSWRRRMRGLVALRRRQLCGCAEQLALRWSFRVERGHLPRLLLSGRDGGVVVVGSARRRRRASPNAVVALLNSTDSADEVVRIARSIASRVGAPLHVVTSLPAGETPEGAELVRRVGDDPRSVAEAMRQSNPRIVVASGRPGAMDEAGLDALRTVLHCPIALVR